jgi:molybdopterin converting factor small subunit
MTGMKVCVKMLGSYRKLLPPKVDGYKFEVEIPTGTTVAGLMKRYDVPLTQDSVFLVNGITPKDLNQLLQDGDAVAVFSAMAGG